MARKLSFIAGFLFAATAAFAQSQPANVINYGGSAGSGSGSCSGAFCAASAPLAANLGGNGLDNSASTGIPLWTAGVQSILGTSGTGNVARVASPTFTGTLTAAAATLTGTLTTNLTGGGTQCVQVNNAGVLAGSGAGCGGSGTVTSVATNAGLTGGTITTSGTIGLAAIAADNLLANSTGSSAAPIATAIGSCSTGSSALTYNTSTHAFGCNTISGSGTVNAGTTPDVAYYASSTAAVSDGGAAAVTIGAVNVASSTIPTNGIYLPSANLLGFARNGVLLFQLGGGFTATNANGVGLSAAAASSTVPTFSPNKSDTTTGIGAQASGNMSFIVGATEVGRVTSTGLNNVNIGATTPGTLAATTGSFSGNLTTNITGSTQCVDVNSSGVAAGIGLDCAASGIGAVIGTNGTTTSPTAAQFNKQFPLYTVNATTWTLNIPAASGLLANGGGMMASNPSANTYTLTPNGTDNLNGANASITVPAHDAIIVTSDATSDFAQVLLGANLASSHLFVGASSGYAADVALSGDATLANTGALTLATVNSNVGSFGDATHCAAFTVNGKGLITAASQSTSCPGSAGGLTVGTTTIASGTTTRILYDNAGVLGEYTLTGSGTVVAMQTSPNFTTPSVGVATGTSLALGGCTIGTDALCATGTATISGVASLGNATVTAATVPVNGLYLSAANQLGLSTNSTDRINLTTANMQSNTAAGFDIAYAAASSTVPVFIPNKNDTTTGIGAQASGNMSEIVGGAELGRWTSTGLNSAAIGATTRSTGAFTTLGANSTITFSGAETNSTAGAASTPALRLSGAAFTGGTGTTTQGLLQIRPASGVTAPTSLSTNGTYVEITGADAFTGNVIDSWVNGNETIKVDYVGNLNVLSAIGAHSISISPSASGYCFDSSSCMVPASGDGTMRFTNGAATGFTRLQLGGTSSSFGGFQTNGTETDSELADGSAATAFGATAFVNLGATPTITGTCTTGSKTGGNTAGRFTATCTTQTIIITFAKTAPTGWNCDIKDLTAPTNLINQASSTTTSCTSASSTTGASDAMKFVATPYLVDPMMVGANDNERFRDKGMAVNY